MGGVCLGCVCPGGVVCLGGVHPHTHCMLGYTSHSSPVNKMTDGCKTLPFCNFCLWAVIVLGYTSLKIFSIIIFQSYIS